MVNILNRRRKEALSRVLDELGEKLDVLREVQAYVENTMYTEVTDVDDSTEVYDNGRFKSIVTLKGQLQGPSRLPIFRPTKIALQLRYTGQINAATYAITEDSVVLAAGEFPYREEVTKVLDELTTNPANNLQRIGVGRYKLV